MELSALQAWSPHGLLRGVFSKGGRSAQRQRTCPAPAYSGQAPQRRLQQSLPLGAHLHSALPVRQLLSLPLQARNLLSLPLKLCLERIPSTRLRRSLPFLARLWGVLPPRLLHREVSGSCLIEVPRTVIKNPLIRGSKPRLMENLRLESGK
jgi:hypothetical protein